MAEATVDFAEVTARLEAAPFQNRTAIEFFSNCLVGFVVSANRRFGLGPLGMTELSLED